MSCTSECHRPRGRQSHCGLCHRTFSGVTIFDDHRKGGACHIPNGMTVKGSIWGFHGSGNDWFKRALL